MLSVSNCRRFVAEFTFSIYFVFNNSGELFQLLMKTKHRNKSSANWNKQSITQPI